MSLCSMFLIGSFCRSLAFLYPFCPFNWLHCFLYFYAIFIYVFIFSWFTLSFFSSFIAMYVVLSFYSCFIYLSLSFHFYWNLFFLDSPFLSVCMSSFTLPPYPCSAATPTFSDTLSVSLPLKLSNVQSHFTICHLYSSFLKNLTIYVLEKPKSTQTNSITIFVHYTECSFYSVHKHGSYPGCPARCRDSSRFLYMKAHLYTVQKFGCWANATQCH